MENQSSKWDDFYRTQKRAWRGVTDIGETPFPEGARILEVGCGNGKTLAALKAKGYNVTGMDFSSEAVDACKMYLGDDTNVIQGDVLAIPFDDNTFNGAVMFHVLENISPNETEKMSSELKRVLSPGSYLHVRSFSSDDLRSGKGTDMGDGTVIRGNGIRYRYLTEKSLIDCFKDFELIKIRTIEENTRFGGIRSRIDALFKS